MSNQLLITQFQKLISEKNKEIRNLKEQKADKKVIMPLNFKVINFNKALNIIKKYPNEIKKGEDLKNEKGIGKGVISRIDEILQKGTLGNELGNNNGLDNKREKLIQITGIGPSKADTLLKLGLDFEKLEKEIINLKYNIENIPDDSILSNLTHHQLIGLKYFHDINIRIPREEIEKILVKINKVVHKIDKKLETIVCGSFRRMKPNSGDIDMLVLHPDIINTEEVSYLQDIVKALTDKNILVDHLTEEGKTKYMGLCKLTKRSKARRIDIRFIPYQSKGAAMLYFTGSGEFNKTMRSIALKKGYTINEYGIYTTKKEGKKQVKNEIVPTSNEKDIFDIVGMDYVEPQNRI